MCYRSLEQMSPPLFDINCNVSLIWSFTLIATLPLSIPILSHGSLLSTTSLSSLLMSFLENVPVGDVAIIVERRKYLLVECRWHGYYIFWYFLQRWLDVHPKLEMQKHRMQYSNRHYSNSKHKLAHLRYLKQKKSEICWLKIIFRHNNFIFLLLYFSNLSSSN